MELYVHTRHMKSFFYRTIVIVADELSLFTGVSGQIMLFCAVLVPSGIDIM